MVLGAGGNFLLLFVAPFCLPQMFANDRDWWLLPAFCLVLAMIHLFIAGKAHFLVLIFLLQMNNILASWYKSQYMNLINKFYR